MAGYAIGNVLAPGNVLLDAPCASFDAGLILLGERLASNPLVSDPSAFLDEVRAREAISSTVTPLGVAFPHARSARVKQLFLLALQPREPIIFSTKLPPVTLLFLLGVPSATTGEYLECMAHLSRKMKEPGLQETLTTVTDPAEFIHLLES